MRSKHQGLPPPPQTQGAPHPHPRKQQQAGGEELRSECGNMADTKIVGLIRGRICRVVLGLDDVGDDEDKGGETRPQHDQQEQGGGEEGKRRKGEGASQKGV